MSKLKNITISLSCIVAMNALSVPAKAFDLSESLKNARNFLSNTNKDLRKKYQQKRHSSQQDEQNKIVDLTLKIETSNSQYLIEKNIDPKIIWVLIEVRKSSATQQIIVKNNHDIIQKNISLLMGSGLYKISLFGTQEDSQYSSKYNFISSFVVENTDSRDMSYLLSTEEVQSDDERIITLARDIISSSWNDMEKIKAVHDYVATLVRYDYDALIDNKYQDEPSDALAVLDHPSAVCSGYSSLAAALLRALGIRARIVHGKATNLKGTFDHAWNEVYIDGEWKSLDVTWDDVVPIRYDYFLPSEANFILDHKKEIIMEYY